MRGPDATEQPDARTFKTNSLLASRPREEVAGGEHSLSDGEIYGLLKSPRRRFVLWYLSRVDEPVPLGELAEQTAAWENDEDVADVDSTERKRAYVALYQCHLPKLDEVDAVSFDPDRKRVDVGSNYEVLAEATHTADEDGSLAPYYLLLAAAGVVLVGGSLVAAGAPDAVTTALVFALVGAFASLASWDYLRTLDDSPSPLAALRDR